MMQRILDIFLSAIALIFLSPLLLPVALILRFTGEGEIFFPELGPISVAGLTFSEMKKSINEIVSKQFIGTQINISLGELRSINVFLLGEVFQPGLYTISSLSTLTNAIFSSGGIRSKGSLRNIQLLIGSIEDAILEIKGSSKDNKNESEADSKPESSNLVISAKDEEE